MWTTAPVSNTTPLMTTFSSLFAPAPNPMSRETRIFTWTLQRWTSSTGAVAFRVSILIRAQIRVSAGPRSRRSRSWNAWRSLDHARALPHCIVSAPLMRKLTRRRFLAMRLCGRSYWPSIWPLSPWHLRGRSRATTSTSSSSASVRNIPTRRGGRITLNSISPSSEPMGSPTALTFDGMDGCSPAICGCMVFAGAPSVINTAWLSGKRSGGGPTWRGRCGLRDRKHVLNRPANSRSHATC